MARQLIRWFETLSKEDVAIAGGKCSSLGELIQQLRPQGIHVPDGFAVTADAYRHFITSASLDDTVRNTIERYRQGEIGLAACGSTLRDAIAGAPMPDDLAAQIRHAYRVLGGRYQDEDPDVAVRSSATAEDLPDASFAGQQDTYLNIRGEHDLLDAVRRCFASLFTDRAISYRDQKGYDHLDVALSVGVQKMVRSDLGCAGVMFTVDTETGFPNLIVIDSAWGLGESVVGGHVTPDEFRVFKPLIDEEGVVPIVDKRLGRKETRLVYGDDASTRRVETNPADRNRFTLRDPEVMQLARWAVAIEEHYGRPMDIEWGKDGHTGRLFVLQARPETVQSRRGTSDVVTWTLDERGEALIEGTAVGNGIAAGRVRVLTSTADLGQFEDGEVLCTTMTDPDWVPLMERAAAIVTDHGGRTSHAAIISRELGIPALVGTGDATAILKTGDEVTVSCAEGDRGHVFAGRLAFHSTGVDYRTLPETRTKVMMIVGNPHTAYRYWQVPCEGVGLARMEFIIGHVLRAHPMALLYPEKVADPDARAQISRLTRGYLDRAEYFVDKLARSMARIAAAQYPHPVIVRLSDFKSNEYADLIGGRSFEPKENNPMLGHRGASRYYSERYKEAFALECKAFRRARSSLGLKNLVAMIPFCRTPWEADRVLEVMADNGLVRGEDGLEVFVMVEVPSNVILADQFAERFDGFSIGSNDLTQLTLGVDRDSGDLTHLFDARNEAVKRLIKTTIEVANRTGTKVGICGQAPSDHPEFAEFLVRCGIDTIAVNPDTLVSVRHHIAAAEEPQS